MTGRDRRRIAHLLSILGSVELLMHLGDDEAARRALAAVDPIEISDLQMALRDEEVGAAGRPVTRKPAAPTLIDVWRDEYPRLIGA